MPTLSEVRAMKERLEETIRTAVAEFEEQTDLLVKGLELGHHLKENQYRTGYDVVVSVNAKVVL